MKLLHKEIVGFNIVHYFSLFKYFRPGLCVGLSACAVVSAASLKDEEPGVVSVVAVVVLGVLEESPRYSSSKLISILLVGMFSFAYWREIWYDYIISKYPLPRTNIFPFESMTFFFEVGSFFLQSPTNKRWKLQN